MPELPELEAIRGVLASRIAGLPVAAVTVRVPVVVRAPSVEYARLLEGDAVTEIWRRGKFLCFSLRSGRVHAVQPMLTGRFRYAEPSARLPVKTCVIWALENGHELRYSDERVMGKIYLVDAARLDGIPTWADMGPDALDPGFTEEDFVQRIRKHPGQVKNILVNHRFVAGIGNAYADEILNRAGVSPFRRRTTLSEEETRRLYHAMRDVLQWAIPLAAEAMGPNLEYGEERRAFLRVHRRGGEQCPVCGKHITEITAGGRITSYCRTCQR
jgi:formamidopyrimidine-DNA glycosylase